MIQWLKSLIPYRKVTLESWVNAIGTLLERRNPVFRTVYNKEIETRFSEDNTFVEFLVDGKVVSSCAYSDNAVKSGQALADALYDVIIHVQVTGFVESIFEPQ